MDSSDENNISQLLENFPDMKDKYKVIEKVGSGSYGSVYKALNLKYKNYRKTRSQQKRKNEETDDYYKYIAIKKIVAICGVDLIKNEISILKAIKGQENIIYLLSAFRCKDEIIIITPHYEFDIFKEFFTTVTMNDVKEYFRSLFNALKIIHSLKIIHRDVKPGNFLYNIKEKKGTLVDFGLSEQVKSQPNSTPLNPLSNSRFNIIKPTEPLSTLISKVPPTSALANTVKKMMNALQNENDPPANIANRKRKVNVISPAQCENRGESSSRNIMPTKRARTSREIKFEKLTECQKRELLKKGYVDVIPKESERKPSFNGHRGGTRGFRAPEVLMRAENQTSAIDIWAAGVILLTILAGRYPFFNVVDDTEDLMEVAILIGKERMKKVADSFGLEFRTNIPYITDTGISFDTLIYRLRRELFSNKVQSADIHDAINLLKKCLEPIASNRITAEEALKHPFLA
ncbi:hypothetical protein Glove_208g138 [Diversispora epigaea]|uniref:non-specific serine/threonine protein kinase n=1 Tax=Diversispora epigaea TaxID=1348612 RepID=A0A397IJA1_9GLOM|nr:hypothetical protein Glove_208g138 [Diversispora epigaea]